MAVRIGTGTRFSLMALRGFLTEVLRHVIHDEGLVFIGHGLREVFHVVHMCTHDLFPLVPGSFDAQSSRVDGSVESVTTDAFRQNDLLRRRIGHPRRLFGLRWSLAGWRQLTSPGQLHLHFFLLLAVNFTWICGAPLRLAANSLDGVFPR